MKTVITGNSGSGKTWLAKKIASSGAKIIHLDTIFWESGGFDQKREQSEIDTLISESINHKEWVAEGVFGELVNRYITEASLFILLDMPWELCRMRLEKRGSESKKHMSRVQSSEGLRKLIDWAGQYYERTNLKSEFGHQQLFDCFKGRKVILRSEEDVTHFIKTLH